MQIEIPKDIELKLYQETLGHMGVHAQRTTANGITKERTEWQEGWNAAIHAMHGKFNALEKWYKSLPEEKRHQIDDLIRLAAISLDEEDGKVEIMVFCSDLFVWGCADAEPLPDDQIPVLLKMVKEDKTGWGDQKWCCIQRNMQPQLPIKEAWISSDVWDESMEALPKNFDEMTAEELDQLRAKHACN